MEGEPEGDRGREPEGEPEDVGKYSEGKADAKRRRGESQTDRRSPGEQRRALKSEDYSVRKGEVMITLESLILAQDERWRHA